MTNPGNLVTMQYTYPEVTKLDTFYTGSDGYLITPEVLPYGNYTLVEVQAPYGYVLGQYRRFRLQYRKNSPGRTVE